MFFGIVMFTPLMRLMVALVVRVFPGACGDAYVALSDAVAGEWRGDGGDEGYGGG